MKFIFFIVVVIIISCAGSKNSSSQGPAKIEPIFQEYPVNCSIRALEVLDKDNVWFAGSNNMFGWTNDGSTWTIDVVTLNHLELEFRSIAVIPSGVFLLNIGSPAILLRSKDQGLNWEVVYREDHPDVFYDSMKFWDDQHGIAMGDPTDGCLSILITNDAGSSWRKLDCAELPPTFDGEAAFAASNTNIAIAGDHVWLATGGAKARIFHSPDQGGSWEVFDTPILHGGAMTGIFTVDFYDEMNGVVFGGNWDEQSINVSNKAITKDGGITWQLINDGKTPGYRSCVQYIPGSEANGIIATGIPGISYSLNGGKSWQGLDHKYYYTIRMAPLGKVAWLAGKNKIAKMEW